LEITTCDQKMVNAVYGQLGSFFALLGALFEDTMLIRFCLVIANLFVMTYALHGWPQWPNVINWPHTAIDVLVWSSLAFSAHLYALAHLIYDERSLRRFKEDDSESLYQFFRNRSGISRRDFQAILSRGRWTKVAKKGTAISTERDFHVVVEGFVSMEIEGLSRQDGEVAMHRKEAFHGRLGSGEMFDLKHANLLNIPIGFFNASFTAVSDSDDVLLFTWDVDALKAFSRSAPVFSQVWRNMIAFCLADMAQTECPIGAENFCGRRHADFSIPPVDYLPRNTWPEFFKWIIKSLDPRLPRGLCRKAIPVTALDCSSVVPTQT
jgi:hypothetical protein